MKELVNLITQLVKNGFWVEITLKNYPDKHDFIRELKQKLKEII